MRRRTGVGLLLLMIGGMAAAKSLVGVASTYGASWDGRKTAYGERFSHRAYTLACRRLPYNTRVRVINLRNGRSVVGRVNDFGPNGRFARSRIVDLSTAMGDALGIDGIGHVRVEVLGKGWR